MANKGDPESRPHTAYGRGEAHPKFNGGRRINERGYVRVTTGRRNNNEAYEHRIVIERLMLEQAILEAVAAIALKLQERFRYYVPDDVMAQAVLCAIKPIILDPPEIPAHLNVHHQNYDKQDNRPANLLLLDSVIHRAITTAHMRFVRRMERDILMAKLRGELQ